MAGRIEPAGLQVGRGDGGYGLKLVMNGDAAGGPKISTPGDAAGRDAG